VGRYRRLLEVIRQNLSDVNVFKVGQRRVSVFIVARTDEGDWAGLKTTAVET
jgi:Nuclease A inhibitor-like protein